MPRQARIVLPDMPHHIIQRGHNRKVVFASNDDFIYYKQNLLEFKKRFGCKVYAYCLMTNHVHLIIDPGRDSGGLALLMKRVSGRQTRYVNKLEKRSGSLWEGRYKSSVISSREYLLSCCRYIELNPVRAAMVAGPAEYCWSSYRCKALGEKDEIVDLSDDPYCSLGDSDLARQTAYRDYVRGAVPDSELALIRQAIQRGQVTGNNRFRREISQKLGIRISNRGPGRPPKNER